MMLVSVLIVSFMLGLDHTYLPPANEVWSKEMFSREFVCPQGGRCLPTGGLHPGSLPTGGSAKGVYIQWGSVTGGRGYASRGWGWVNPLELKKRVVHTLL